MILNCFWYVDVSDIQSFVTVALATGAGGEDDLAHDKLSHLRTVGSGFACFIYNISDQDGYKQLEVKCKSLWEALEENPGLPKLVVGLILHICGCHRYIFCFYVALKVN